MNDTRSPRSAPVRAGLWAVILAAASAAGCGPPEPAAKPRLSVTGVLRGDDQAGYARADHVGRFHFPEDHGAHGDFKSEWWYFTGNLLTPDQRHFGFQYTLFRSAVSPEPARSGSNWDTHQVYLAHLALTDTRRGRFLSDERFARGALGLAGASAPPFHAWLEDWEAVALPAVRCINCFDVAISARTGDFALDLSLSNSKPMVLHGDRGLSLKSSSGDNASYYYSYPRLATEGRVTVDGVTHAVTGYSWFDHEWSTSSLEPDQIGWDWFSMQLNDNTELMLFQLRHVDDESKYFRYGTYVDARGNGKRLAPEALRLQPVETWRSPDSGARYPIAWHILVPELDLELSLRAVIPGQEMRHSFRYWEGAVEISGTRAGGHIAGRGYLELTGYD